MSFLDDAPVATITFLAGVVLTIIAYISNDVNFQDALVALGALGGGTGALGYARASSNKGIRR